MRTPLIRRDTRGSSLVEYLILVGVVALVGLVGFRVFGARITSKAQQEAGCVASLEASCGAGAAGPASGGGRSAPRAVPAGREGAASSAGNARPSSVASRRAPSAAHPPPTVPHRGAAYWANGIAKGFIGEGVDTVKSLARIGVGSTLIGAYYYARTGQPNPAVEAGVAIVRLGISATPGGRVVAALGGPDALGDAMRGAVRTVVDRWRRDPADLVGRGVFEVATFIAPYVKVKWVGDATKVTELARAGELERAAEATTDVARTAETTSLARDTEQSASAAAGADEATALVTNNVMERYGLTRDSEVYRVMDPAYLDTATNTVAGNARSMALVEDVYHPVENPIATMMREAGYGDLPGLPQTIPPQVNASSIGPGLNVAVENPAAYAQDGSVLIAIRVDDILQAGGRIYPDAGAMAQNIKPLYVTFGGKVPYRIVHRPP